MAVLLIVLGLIAAFAAVLLIRTARFTPKPEPAKDPRPVEFDKDRAVYCLQQLLRCKTVSYPGHEGEDPAEFEKLIALLPELYPNVYKTCTLTRMDDYALLFHWKGKDPKEPAIMMAHFDVVPVNMSGWDKDPFSGIIEDGVLWGRGALDTKPTFNGALFGVDTLIGQGFVPEHDVYLAFSGGEEISGPGAEHIVDWFEEQGITPGMVLDEGGAVVEGIFPGVTQPCGLIGIAEKGMVNLEFKVKSNGGHASAPAPHTPIGILSNACAKLEDHPFKLHMCEAVSGMFDTLGRYSTFVYRLIFSNLWCFQPVLDALCKKTGGEMNAMMRTTVAFTQMAGSEAINVIPPVAVMAANLRLNPLDSIQSAQDYVTSVVDDHRVNVSVLSGQEPSRISRTDVDAWEKVRSAVANTWEGCIVAPYLMVQCSDSRHYSRISDRVYRFSAQDMNADERHMLHGNNERIRLETIEKACAFYIRLLRQC